MAYFEAKEATIYANHHGDVDHRIAIVRVTAHHFYQRPVMSGEKAVVEREYALIRVYGDPCDGEEERVLREIDVTMGNGPQYQEATKNAIAFAERWLQRFEQ